MLPIGARRLQPLPGADQAANQKFAVDCCQIGDEQQIGGKVFHREPQRHDTAFGIAIGNLARSGAADHRGGKGIFSQQRRQIRLRRDEQADHRKRPRAKCGGQRGPGIGRASINLGRDDDPICQSGGAIGHPLNHPRA